MSLCLIPQKSSPVHQDNRSKLIRNASGRLKTSDFKGLLLEKIYFVLLCVAAAPEVYHFRRFENVPLMRQKISPHAPPMKFFAAWFVEHDGYSYSEMKGLPVMVPFRALTARKEDGDRLDAWKGHYPWVITDGFTRSQRHIRQRQAQSGP